MTWLQTLEAVRHTFRSIKLKLTAISLLVVVSILASSCARESKPVRTPLEIQVLQSREYEAKKEVVFPSVISVFQDIGYTISHADVQTGIISAESPSNSDSSTIKNLLLGIAGVGGVTKVSQTKATAFVEQIRTKTKVRLNFVEVNKTSSEWGQNDRQDTPLLEAELYNNAFEKIENAIFIRRSY